MSDTKSYRMIFGIDIGISSVGWAVINRSTTDATDGSILGMGSWCFNAPEDKKKPLNQIRREKRLARRNIKRRYQRARAIKRLFFAHGLIPTDASNALDCPGIDPWVMRYEGLDRVLSGVELAVALGHIAKHRGFKSNAKTKSDNGETDLESIKLRLAKADEKQAAKLAEKALKGEVVSVSAQGGDDKLKVLNGVARLYDTYLNYRSIAEAFMVDDKFKGDGRKRNRHGKYDRSVYRDWLVDETRKIFEAQRGFGSQFAASELEEEFINIAFHQNPMKDVEAMVGRCRFEPLEKRAPRFSYSFEKFRLLSNLTKLTYGLPAGPDVEEFVDESTGEVYVPGHEHKLSSRQISEILYDFPTTATITYKKIRGILGLPDAVQFLNARQIVSGKDGFEGQDVTSRSGSAAYGSRRLRDVLGEDLWGELINDLPKLDQIAHILSFFKTNLRIKEELSLVELPAGALDLIIDAVDRGEFAKFTGAGSLSLKALRAINPYLALGYGYNEACSEAGYDFQADELKDGERIVDKASFKRVMAGLEVDILNPIVRKAVHETMKQIRTLVCHYGLPDAMHIELARDLGMSVEDRGKMELAQIRQEKARNAAIGVLETMATHVSNSMIERYLLWVEQEERCIYTGEAISIQHVIGEGYYADQVQVDHILPRSRSYDNGFNNKVLCLSSVNQNKRNLTPIEWMTQNRPDLLEDYKTRVLANSKMKKRKKANLLMLDYGRKEEGFLARNLNDTRYAAKLVAQVAALFYPKKTGKRHIFTRPGQLTAMMRKYYGLNDLKYVEETVGDGKKSKRVEDSRHHGIDALVVATITETEYQKLSRLYKAKEDLTQDRYGMELPWPEFVEQARDFYDRMIVARPVKAKASGEFHGATIYEKAEVKGTLKAVKRIRVTDLGMERGKFIPKKAHDELLKAKDREIKVELINALERWIDAGAPKDEASLPRAPDGNIIRKIKIMTEGEPSLLVRGGYANRGDMCRVDVFSSFDKKGKKRWFLVPVYLHHLSQKEPPNQYVTGKKSERWGEISSEHVFEFSLTKGCYVVVVGKNETKRGVFTSMDIAYRRIEMKSNNIPDKASTGEAMTVQKYCVDRLGSLHQVKKEPRLWHGKVFTLRGVEN